MGAHPQLDGKRWPSANYDCGRGAVAANLAAYRQGGPHRPNHGARRNSVLELVSGVPSGQRWPDLRRRAADPNSHPDGDTQTDSYANSDGNADPANCSHTGSGGHSKRDTDSEGDTDSDPNGDGDLHPNGAPNLDGDCYPYGDCYTDGDRNLDAGTNRNGSTDSLSHAEPYAVTDPDGNANGDGTRAIAHVSPDTGAPGPDGRRRAQCGALGVRNRGGDSVGRNGLYAHAAQARRAQGVGTSD